MKMTSRLALRASLVLLLCGCGALRAQDNVTIPKSRLQELEQKEAELEKLKGKPVAPQTPQAAPAVAPSSPAPALRKPDLPPLNSLPPLQEGEKVDSAELAAFYQQDKAGADKRFLGRKLSVHGEIVAFGKPLLRRNYRVILQGTDRNATVTCDLLPPTEYKAVFTVDDGTQLVGLVGETRVPLAKLGGKVIVEGKCKGLRGNSVLILGERMGVMPSGR